MGVEMAQAWSSLGTRELTLVEAMGNLISSGEPFASELVAQSLAEQGVSVITGKNDQSAP